MAMIVTLRDKIGNELIQQDIGMRPAYPEIITMDDKFYVLKQVSRDKKAALYGEADKIDIAEAE